MIQPDEIRRKAEKLYPAFLRAWLAGESYFPHTIPCDKQLDDNLTAASESIRQLKLEARETRGYGYSVEWEERRSRTHGRNSFPRRIVFETQDDLLRYIGKEREFARFTSAVERVRLRYPILEPWIRSHRQLLIDSATQLDGLLQVVDFLIAHPRPGLFARELPLDVDTKFIERNQRVLREWLDVVLPPHDIRADEDHFGRRFGLRVVEPLIHIRFLDDAVRQSSGSPWHECAVPLQELAASNIQASHALIVENKVNLLTLPQIEGFVAMGGMGNGVTDLRYLEWLCRINIWYWGDIDVEGFEILSRLRAVFPPIRSLLMDEKTLLNWRDRLASAGTGRGADLPPNLSQSEQVAFRTCAAENLRIEQERLPQQFILDCLTSTFAGTTGLPH